MVFHGEEYAAHTSCISEAEKYEKSLFKGKAKKLNPQDLWIALVEEAASDSGKAPAAIQTYLKRLGELGNVPRNSKKFVNFVKNSLKIQNEHLIGEIWAYLEKLRVERTKEQGEAAAPSSSSKVAPEPEAEPEAEPEDAVEGGGNEEERLEKKRLKRLRKEAKKRKREEAERAARAAEVQPEPEEKKEKKEKEEKKEKKRRRESDE